jgi:predicted metal-dependent hydrolase
MHELCHLIHPNHSKQFNTFLTMLIPDWKERKDYLDKSAAYWLQEENLQQKWSCRRM